MAARCPRRGPAAASGKGRSHAGRRLFRPADGAAARPVGPARGAPGPAPQRAPEGLRSAAVRRAGSSPEALRFSPRLSYYPLVMLAKAGIHGETAPAVALDPSPD